MHFENTIFGQDFSILTSHKHSLAHVSYFRLLDTNKQTDRQTGKYSIQDIYERGLLNRLRFDNYWFLEGDELLFGACKLLYLSKPTSFPKIRGVFFSKNQFSSHPPFKQYFFSPQNLYRVSRKKCVLSLFSLLKCFKIGGRGVFDEIFLSKKPF